jgi:hypothetical protein
VHLLDEDEGFEGWLGCGEVMVGVLKSFEFIYPVYFSEGR